MKEPNELAMAIRIKIKIAKVKSVKILMPFLIFPNLDWMPN